jgi:hypothetical protein
MDRSTGPVKGYFISVYACQMGELGKEHLGYFKVCRSLPQSYWEADCIFKGCTPQLYRTAQEALLEAEKGAAAIIGEMPPLAQFAELRRFALGC